MNTLITILWFYFWLFRWLSIGFAAAFAAFVLLNGLIQIFAQKDNAK